MPSNERRTAWGGSTRRETLPHDWAARRRHVLRRDDHRCQIRDPGCVGHARDVDHINSRDDHRTENLRSACPACHGTRSGRQGGTSSGQVRRARADARYRTPEPHPGEQP